MCIRDRSNKYLEMYEQVAKRFQGKISFVWVDNEEQKSKRELLGIYHDKLPAFAFNMLKDQRKFSIKEEVPINYDTLMKFCGDFLSNRLEDMREQRPKEKPALKSTPKHKIYKEFNETIELDHEKFQELVLKEGKDAMVMFFNSQSDQDLDYSAKNYNRAAQRFKQLAKDNVIMCIYDLYYHPSPSEISSLVPPSIYFFPAFTKQAPYKAYTGQVKALALMLWIQESSDVEFDLPDLPHLPEELHAEYYRQKYRMDKEKEIRDKHEKGEESEENDNIRETKKRDELQNLSLIHI
eukprot:TRINITY_DN7323_c0_g2_i4.p1 TRINITY_DN7323_c0_g2~~TRINITY_DN7323_c0_g2_i4.p1  ORF type:complete len:314 (-),score=77.70 TRINITY_DN7323_c0_g2_i4:57-938(-)